MDKKLIDRINFLANKQKEVGLSEFELKEQATLRQQYLNLFKANFKLQLDNIKIVDDSDDEKR